MSSTNSGSIDGKVRTWVISSCHVVDWTYITDIALQFATALIDRAHGMTAFEYHGTDPQFNKVFNNGMVHHSTITMKKILEMYKGFEGLKTVVDVGGGTGAVFNMIISKYPHTKGINFDLPHVLSDAPNYPGVEQVGGDMFVSVPSGDAIFMKSDGNGRWEFLFPYLRLQGFKVEGRWQPLSDKQCWCPLPHIQYHQYHLLHQVVCRANFCGLVVRSSSYMHMEQHLYVVLFAMQ